MKQAIFASRSYEYLVKVAQTVEEACTLIEVGFEYVTDVDNAKLFRKRKRWIKLKYLEISKTT
jgi:hypothetical protein